MTKLRTAFHWYNQWCNPFRQNWFDFDLIHVGFEVAAERGTILELTLRLLGIGFVWEVWHEGKRQAFCAPIEKIKEDYLARQGNSEAQGADR